MDVGEYLDQWMVRQRLQLQPRTWDAYQLTIEMYIAPTLAGTPLDALRPAAIEQLYGELLDHGGRGDRPLSLATIRHVHGVLHKALADAVRIDLLSANPADRVALPRRDLRGNVPATVHAWTADEARRFLQRIGDDAHASLWAVALGTGMRRGELLGLRWRDVDLDDRLVTVTGSLLSTAAACSARPPRRTGSAACSSTAAPPRRSNANDGRPHGRPPPTSTAPR